MDSYETVQGLPNKSQLSYINQPNQTQL